jgi:Flp pilus assembly pilin Flp
MRDLLIRFMREEGAQDLVEYALLAAFIGFCGAAAWLLIQQTIGTIYAAFDTAEQNLWRPDDPPAPPPG